MHEIHETCTGKSHDTADNLCYYCNCFYHNDKMSFNDWLDVVKALIKSEYSQLLQLSLFFHRWVIEDSFFIVTRGILIVAHIHINHRQNINLRVMQSN